MKRTENVLVLISAALFIGGPLWLQPKGFSPSLRFPAASKQ